MILIYIFMALAVAAVAVGSIIAGLLLNLILRRFIASPRRSLGIAILIGWAFSSLLFWSPFPLDGNKALVLGLGLIFAMLPVPLFARRKQ